MVILTVVDHFSKVAHFIPLSKLPSSKETADTLVHQVFRLHGIPTDIVLDRGPQVVRGMESLLCCTGGYGQSVLWLSPSVKWTDGKNQPVLRNFPEMHVFRQPHFKEHATPLDSIRP